MTSSIAALLVRAMVDGEDEQADRTAVRILDAVVLEVATSGAAKLTIEGVARRAGVNRATIYRRFGDLDGVKEAATMREGRRMAEVAARAIEGVNDPADRLVETFVAAIRIAREHPVISRVAVLEPGQLIAAGLADDAALLHLGSGVVAVGIRQAQAEGHALHIDAEEMGQTIAMLFAACVVLPATQGIDLRTDESVRAYARRTLVPMIFGPNSARAQ
ncbi:MAG: TetR family transcriptional regulator [Nocardia sp.]|uniref:TetR/AcrR family transcriptional regulator n=1 Tax=Nocardia sp. TaxID=1821 RepID=UPI00261FF97F|nr:TetR/AcrR family transcriptional regulator [Nocardia sp.]MCU1644150.1 TetR family transcriptional regulator [Nocardia sp.]